MAVPEESDYAYALALALDVEGDRVARSDKGVLKGEFDYDHY